MSDKPWLTEPDTLTWTDEVTGFECQIIRHPELLHLCGYVKVTPEHPLWNNQKAEEVLNVHGGVTFQGLLHDDGNGYYIGFDCGHCLDYIPGMYELFTDKVERGTYRDINFVKQECENLALQLKDYRSPV